MIKGSKEGKEENAERWWRNRKDSHGNRKEMSE